MSEGEQTPSPAQNPLADRLERAIRAHPVLRDQKKLHVSAEHGFVRVHGVVFTRDMYRQVLELIDRVAGSERVQVEVEPEIRAPEAPRPEGDVPKVSEGPSNVDRSYSVGHLDRPRRRRG